MGMEGTMICENCRKVVPVENMKLIPAGNKSKSVCVNCLARQKGEEVKIKPINVSKHDDFDAKSSAGTLYYCNKCQYKFRSSSAKPVCGYCGKPDTIKPC
jgi:hypothetical protein